MTNDALWVPLKANPPYGPVGNARRDALVKYAERLARRPDFPAQLNALSSLVLAVEPEDLPDLLQQELPDLFKLLPDASVWWLDVDRVLVRRFAFLRARLALELTPDIDTSPSLSRRRKRPNGAVRRRLAAAQTPRTANNGCWSRLIEAGPSAWDRRRGPRS